MARVVRYIPQNVHSAPPKSGQEANLVEGLFCSVDSNGDMILADFRNTTYGRPPARGVITQSCNIHDQLGNVLQHQAMVPFTTHGRVGGFTGLTPGATYYLSSGGAIQPTKPGTTNDLNQEVGFAIDDTVLVLNIGPEVIA